ncbi:MAG: AbrB/MazE/SpoVT family DNA-binding domain-containing protein [Candidatus Thermoplasmatota archaeon]|nr:AbrB/MazE/SpoVT family DNA-binding domain-containing protein [Candidatus Thermoplasmatota archaeon]MBU4070599.1 AbrB/MazE/SpoVT family DNA-binding domain-containing protein [Candidatus Thermoplasmatota archaeon]MBU4144109.1 AbrB/MazE/SpoVT family DNA-binding domain-containing protein [Candidatus Thermoplasmatota archaeon]MBU4591824.1 AbrB/MazE/SpoVT family DNA-binding domain-containing protein [Candidatus Thermoplasmatota archaeon]
MGGMKCVACGKTAKPMKLSFQGKRIDGWKCKCGEEYFEPEQAQRILLLNQIQKEQFRVKLGRVRSNLILRIPKRIADALELKDGEVVTVRVEGSGEIRVLTG